MSYSQYSSSSSRLGVPRGSLVDDAEFQAAKMQAMMGAPMGGTGGTSRTYSYRSSGNSSIPTNLSMDSEMRRMEREMGNSLGSSGQDADNASSSYSSSSRRTSSGGVSSPTPITIKQDPTNGTAVKKVVTTTTTKSNPHAVRELERLERDFNRMGRTPDDYHDDFDQIKREITTGDAYRESPSISSHEQLRNTPSFGSGSQRETKTTTTRTFSSGSRNPAQADISEVFIPVRTYDNTFDNFHMNRWLDHRDNFGSIGAKDLDTHKLDWENRLRGVKGDMFKFSPHSDFGNASIESSRTVTKKKRPLRRSQSLRTTRTYHVDCMSTRNPMGNPEFSIQFDMREFKADDISLSTKNGKLIICATHEDKIGKSTSRREFTRSVDLPADIQINMMRSVFSRDGILSITAPIKPPHYDPLPSSALHPSHSESAMQAFNAPFTSHDDHLSSSYRSPDTRQLYTTAASNKSSPFYSQVSPKYGSRQSSNTEEMHKPMDYTVPVSGYLPEEITVSIENHKVKVSGKHVESRLGGRKTHNEFTKTFDLPSDVEAKDVRCYIKEGHTLHVIAHIGEDIQGLVHFLAVEKN